MWVAVVTGRRTKRVASLHCSRHGLPGEPEGLEQEKVILSEDITVSGKYMVIRVTLRRPNTVVIEEFEPEDKTQRHCKTRLECELAEAITGDLPTRHEENKAMYQRMCKRLAVKVRHTCMCAIPMLACGHFGSIHYSHSW